MNHDEEYSDYSFSVFDILEANSECTLIVWEFAKLWMDEVE